MTKSLTIAKLGAFMLTMSATAFAADDPSIKGEFLSNIKKAMLERVASNTIDGEYIFYDAVEGELRRLTV